MGNILSKYYHLSSQDKKRIYGWKGKDMNCKNWEKTLLHYNSCEYCERCGNQFTFNKYTKKSSKVLDHDHYKCYNNIRGVICVSCNSSLRYIDNNVMPDFIPEYIKKNKYLFL